GDSLFGKLSYRSLDGLVFETLGTMSESIFHDLLSSFLQHLFATLFERLFAELLHSEFSGLDCCCLTYLEYSSKLSRSDYARGSGDKSAHIVATNLRTSHIVIVAHDRCSGSNLRNPSGSSQECCYEGNAAALRRRNAGDGGHGDSRVHRVVSG